MNNISLDRADVRAIVKAMAAFVCRPISEICPTETEDNPPHTMRVVDTRETPDDFKGAAKEWSSCIIDVGGVKLIHGERWLGGKWPRFEFIMATTTDGWTLDLIIRAFDRMTIDTHSGDATMDPALGGDRHSQMRKWMQGRGLSDVTFAAKISAPLTTVRKWIYEGRPPRAANRAIIARAFPDCPALRWK